MQTPKYKSPVTVGGTSQTVVFEALADQIINRQSGELSLFYQDEDGNDFEMSSLTTAELKSTPWDSGTAPVTIATAIVVFAPEIVDLTSAATPATSGTFTIDVNGEVTSALAFDVDDAAILTALGLLASRVEADFIVNRRNGRDLGVSGTIIQIETSGTFAIDYPITIDTSSLDIPAGITLTQEQAGTDIQNTLISTWAKDTIPASYSQVDFDRDGAIVFYVITESATEFYQAYQRITIIDDSFEGQNQSGSNLDSYNYVPTDANAWGRYSSVVPSTVGGALDTILLRNFSDFGAVIDISTTPPVSPSNLDSHLIGNAGATGDWVGQENKVATWSSILVAWQFSSTHKEGDRVRNLDDDNYYAVQADDTTWAIDSGISDGSVTNIKMGDMIEATWKGRITGAGTGAPTDVTTVDLKTELAITNVDDTSDVNKPISTLTQTALDLKLDATATAVDSLALGTYALDDTDVSNTRVIAFDSGSGDLIFVDQTAAGSGINLKPMAFNTTTTIGGLPSGTVRFNNATPASVTEIFVHNVDADGKDIGTSLTALAGGNVITVKEDSSKFLRVSVNTAVDNGTTHTLGVTLITAGVLPTNAATVALGMDFIISGAGGTITSVFGRNTPAIVAVVDDYSDALITNTSTVTGATVKDALDLLDSSKQTSAEVDALIAASDKINQEDASTGNNRDSTGTETLVLTDKDNMTITSTSGSDYVISIDTFANVAIPVGSKIGIIMGAAGIPTITGLTGVTVNGNLAGDVVMANAQFQAISLYHYSSNVWYISGSIA